MIDEDLGDELRVTVIATGFDKRGAAPDDRRRSTTEPRADRERARRQRAARR